MKKPNIYTAHRKVWKSIDSCVNYLQLETAEVLLDLFKEMFPNKNRMTQSIYTDLNNIWLIKEKQLKFK